MLKFQVGDVVEVVDGMFLHAFGIGEVVQITEIKEKFNYPYRVKRLDEDFTDLVHESHITKVKEDH